MAAARTSAAASSEPPQRLALGQTMPVASHFVPTVSITGAGGASTASSTSVGASSSASNATPAAAAAATSSLSSLVNPTSLALSLPYSTYSVPVSHVDVQALHYLTIEMPHALRNGARRSNRKRRQVIAQMRDAGLNVDGLTAAQSTYDEDEEVIKRLESIGAHAGATFVERLSRDRPPFPNTLDVLKFICKELWPAIWEKQVDNLRTNHKGVYVLQDNVFKPLLRLSLPSGPGAAKEAASTVRIQLAIPTGIIRGALGRLNVASTVVAETNQIPQCTFHIKTSSSRG